MAPVLKQPLPLEGEFVAEAVAEDEGEPVTFTLDPVFFAPVLAAVGAADPPRAITVRRVRANSNRDIIRVPLTILARTDRQEAVGCRRHITSTHASVVDRRASALQRTR